MPCTGGLQSSKRARDELVAKMTEKTDNSLAFELQAAERLEAAGRLGEAGAIYQDLQTRFPEAAEVYRRFGRLSSHEGNAERALSLLSQARDLAPQDPRVRIDLAETLVGAGRLQDAVPEVEQAIALAPENGDYRVKRALLHLSQGEREAAASCCQEALARAPETKGAHQLLGNLDWQRGALEASATSLLAARQAEPPAADPNGLLAMTLFALGRPREIAGLTRAQSDSQLYIEVVMQAVYTWEAGKFEYCRQILERARSIHTQVADANRTLVFRPLHRILSALLEFGVANAALYEQEAVAPLMVLGDNQVLKRRPPARALCRQGPPSALGLYQHGEGLAPGRPRGKPGTCRCNRRPRPPAGGHQGGLLLWRDGLPLPRRPHEPSPVPPGRRRWRRPSRLWWKAI